MCASGHHRTAYSHRLFSQLYIEMFNLLWPTYDIIDKYSLSTQDDYRTYYLIWQVFIYIFLSFLYIFALMGRKISPIDHIFIYTIFPVSLYWHTINNIPLYDTGFTKRDTLRHSYNSISLFILILHLRIIFLFFMFI